MEAYVAMRLTPRTPDLEVQGSSLARRIVSLVQELYSALSLFTQVYKWVLATYCWEITLRWTSIPSRGGGRGGGDIPLGILQAKETGISSGRFNLWLLCAFTFF